MCEVKIEMIGSKLVVQSPYNSLFVEGAKKLGGRFSNASWSFDIRDEERVRALCFQAYGTDGVRTDQVTLRIRWRKDAKILTSPISCHGRSLARAHGRDGGARLCDGIVVLSGGFDSCGSVKNWYTSVSSGTEVLVRDFPRKAAEDLVAAPSENRVYSIEPEAPKVDKDALAAEKAALLERLAQIEALLAS